MSAPAPNAAAPNALEVTDLDVAYRIRGRDRQVLRGVSFSIAKGESFGLVGESACGKSTAAFAIVRHLPRNGRIRNGSVRVDGRDLLGMSRAELREIRARSISMVYQDAARALNPSIRVGRQIAEVFEVLGSPRKEAAERAEAMLHKVQIADAGSVMQRYPHQLSGGMQQRVVIAMALASDPTLLILDEPTTGLDATVEAEVLELVSNLRQEFGASVLFISHNLGVIAKMCDRVGVLYAGKIVEEGPARALFDDPRHPYTVGLLRCIPRGGMRKDQGRLDSIPGFLPPPGAELPGCVFADRCPLADDRCRTDPPPLIPLNGRATRCWYHEQAQDIPRQTPEVLPPVTCDRSAAPVLRAEDVSKTFRQGISQIHALQDVSVELWPGETLGLVGESGSGKTTFARVLLGITKPDPESVVVLDDHELPGTTGKRSQEDIRSIQIVFQNPDQALNQRHAVKRIVGRALERLAGLRGRKRDDRMLSLTRSVRLADRYLSVRPASLSGGLKQRVAIARAFAGNPRVVVCDEPTSALDVSVQAAILNLLGELQRDEQTSYIFISHDLGVVRYLSDRIAVLYLGRLMEVGPADSVFEPPHHPYTEALLSAVPTLEGEERPRIRLEGDIPSASHPPSGCVFHTRCPRRLGEICDTEEPPLAEVEPEHFMRCHIPIDELRRLQASPPPERTPSESLPVKTT
jgi:peptide/nickel transport system ATP-binding protein